jgi:predicted PurR-regulated permease PerM
VLVVIIVVVVVVVVVVVEVVEHVVQLQQQLVSDQPTWQKWINQKCSPKQQQQHKTLPIVEPILVFSFPIFPLVYLLHFPLHSTIISIFTKKNH